jgi:hypothetical protein
MTHHCHARGCTARCRPELLMCPGHWRQVPRKIQRAVLATYRPGQCDDMDPSEQWHETADAVIGYVAALDREPLRVCEVTPLRTFGYGVSTDSHGDLYVHRADAPILCDPRQGKLPL